MAATINRKVLDLSHWNTVTDWDAIEAAGIEGIIYKATQGTSYKDPTYLDSARAALNRGFLWGAYHFLTTTNVASQVDNFLSVVGVDNETLYALDWETESHDDGTQTTPSEAQAQEFVERLEQRIGANRCVVYSGNVAKEKIKGADPFWGARRLWLAHYSSSPTCQASWPTYWLWQYSDSPSTGPGPHGCPGVSGDVDVNSWLGTDAELRAQWSGAKVAPAPPAEMVTVEIKTTGPVRLIVNGQAI